MKSIFFKNETDQEFFNHKSIGFLDYLNFEKTPQLMEFYQNKANIQLGNFGLDFNLEKEMSYNFSFGHPIMTLLQDPDQFFATYVCPPQVDKRTEAGKRILALFEEQTKDLTVLSPSQMDIIQKAASIIQTDENLLPIIEACQIGITGYFQDEENQVKIRPTGFLSTANTVLQLIVTDRPIGVIKFRERMQLISDFNKYFLHRETVFIIVNTDSPQDTFVASTAVDTFQTFTGHVSSTFKMIFWCQACKIFPNVNSFPLLKKLNSENRIDDYFMESSHQPMVAIV